MTKRIVVKGAVQGIGYRPFISEKATEYGLSGYVKNCGASVEILVSGEERSVDSFIVMLSKEVPAGGFILSVDVTDDSEGCNGDENKIPKDASEKGFKIIDSSELDLSSEIPVFLPDIGICDDCIEEMLDPSDRRYRYPLISCAVCGPRMSILNALPYDRDNTTMEDFHMCPSCQKDYKMGRRHYAQTISCHDCGPQMILKDSGTSGEESVQKAIELIKDGKIIGLKGISGYQLVCKPIEDVAKRFRSVKGRENKPFAIMFSTVEQVREYAHVSPLEEELLRSSARPIVLVEKLYQNTDGASDSFGEEVLKKSRYIGAFLPSAGIHRLLIDECGPLIVTSANRSDEPMIIDDQVFTDTFMNPAIERDWQADAVLFHERKINMPQDDSVMFVISANGKETSQFIRRARGFAPLPMVVKTDESSFDKESSVLALGGDLKSSFSFGKKDRILPSQYIGDLKDLEVMKSYEKLLLDYERIFDFHPDFVVKDMHPAYISSSIAGKLQKDKGLKCIELQHHFAHIYSVMAENSLTCAMGVSFDGTGYGCDGCIWGGEFLYINGQEQLRKGHLSYVKLAGGDEAPKNAKNVAMCYMHECEKRKLLDKEAVSESTRLLSEKEGSSFKLLEAALDNNINTFETSSAGRLFDAVSALLGICDYNSYEGEAAIMLESRALDFQKSHEEGGDYPVFSFKLTESEDGFTADQTALYADICNCLREGRYDNEAIAYGFHMAIKKLIIKSCNIMAKADNCGKNAEKTKTVCLSGGVFNNRLLLTETVEALVAEGYEVYWNRKVPLGDGGISTGQAYFGLMCQEQ